VKAAEKAAASESDSSDDANVSIPESTIAAVKIPSLGKVSTGNANMVEPAHAVAEPKKVPKKKYAPLVIKDESSGDEGWNTVAAKPVKPKDKEEKKKSTPEAPQKAAAVKLPEEVIQVDRKLHGMLAGPKFATMNKLQDLTNTRVSLPGKDSDSCDITISGSPEGIKECRRAINDLVSKGYSKLLNPSMVDSHIFIPVDKRFRVSGKGGEYIKMMENTFNVRIRLPNRESTEERVFIVGEPASVKQARACVTSLRDFGFSPLTHKGWTKFEMPFPREKVGLLVGPKGQKIKNIQADSKCQLLVPDYVKSQELIIVGPADGVELAKKLVDRVLNPIVRERAPAPEEVNEK
jgi:rRNA processing protein Krr1/Pno1